MSESIQLPQEEIDNLFQLQQTQQNIVTQFGQIEYQIQLLEIQKDQLVEVLTELKQQETALGEKLTKKYGNGTINLESGTFIKE
jgi:hypothetical protein